jgi:hypothetical protein
VLPVLRHMCVQEQSMVTCYMPCNGSEILEHINQTESESVQGFKLYGVKSLGGNLTLYLVLIKLAEPSVSTRVKTVSSLELFSLIYSGLSWT